jgi:hypothetical protein
VLTRVGSLLNSLQFDGRLRLKERSTTRDGRDGVGHMGNVGYTRVARHMC